MEFPFPILLLRSLQFRLVYLLLISPLAVSPHATAEVESHSVR